MQSSPLPESQFYIGGLDVQQPADRLLPEVSELCEAGVIIIQVDNELKINIHCLIYYLTICSATVKYVAV